MKPAKRSYAKVLTANDLLEGDVVYLAENDSWTRNHGEARLIEDKDEAESLLAKAGQRQDVLVGPYLADAERGPDGKPQPIHFREAFRTRGPSNYPHGKQAEA